MNGRGVGLRSRVASLVPAGLLLVGVAGRAALHPGRDLPLQAPLSGLAASLDSLGPSRAVAMPEAERRMLAADALFFHRFTPAGKEVFDLFVAYYGRQRAGSSVHSPQNCLPGSGWEPLEHVEEPLHTARADGRINRYVVQNDKSRRALVYYWYQGRGRIVADEYRVRWYLLSDAVLRRRTDEALVRLVFPLERGEDVARADARLQPLARAVASHLWDYLPPAPGS